MLVDEWVETVWIVLNIREKTLKDYRHLYKSHLKRMIGTTEIDLVLVRGYTSKTNLTAYTDY
jgi:hypothetical protein